MSATSEVGWESTHRLGRQRRREGRVSAQKVVPVGRGRQGILRGRRLVPGTQLAIAECHRDSLAAEGGDEIEVLGAYEPDLGE